MQEAQKEAIYKNYYSKVRSYLTGKLLNVDIAEDLASDVFMKVYEKLDGFDETKASISTWIFTITRNTLTDYYRTRRDFSEIPEEQPADSDIEEEYCTKEQLGSLADALAALPQRERDLIILHYYSGKTLKDAAVSLGISYAYAKILHNKALESMKQYL